MPNVHLQPLDKRPTIQELLNLPEGATAHTDQLESAAVVHVRFPSDTVTLVLPYEWFIEPEVHGQRLKEAVKRFRENVAARIAQREHALREPR